MNERERQHQRNIERYLAEGRTVSGGDINPPGHPGYVSIVFFDGNNHQLLSEFIAFAQSKGFQIEQQTSTAVLLSNYQES